MAGVLDLPFEVLLQILEIGCDQEYLDGLIQLDRFPEFPASRSLARQCKGFVKPLVDVCKRWRSLVNGTPQLWVTRIAVAPHLETVVLEHTIELIEQSSGSDLDIHISMRQLFIGKVAVEDLFKQYLLPLSPRWRCLHSESSAPQDLGFIWDALSDDLPRLVMLRLSLLPRSLNSARNRLPRLKSLAMDHFSCLQTAVQFPFVGLKSIRLSQSGRHLIDRESVVAVLSLSSTTLTHLSVDFSNNIAEATHVTVVDDKLILPSLKELRIQTFYPETALKLLELCTLPNLERLSAQANSDEPPSHADEILLPQVSWLHCNFYSCIFVQFFTTVKTPLLRSLVLFPKDDWDSPAPQPHPAPLFPFPRLEFCEINWYYYRQSEDALSAFVSQFDFNSIRFLRIFGTGTMGYRILNIEFATHFPNMRKVGFKGDSFLFFIVPTLPSVHSLEGRSRMISAAADTWERLEVDAALRVQDLRIRLSDTLPLHISVMARPFADVESVTLDCRSLLQPDTYANVFNTLLDENFNVTRDAMTKLHTLRVILPEDDARLLIACIQPLKGFVMGREQSAHPIRKLQMTTLPSEPEHSAWFQLHVPEFSKFVHEGHDSQLDWY